MPPQGVVQGRFEHSGETVPPDDGTSDYQWVGLYAQRQSPGNLLPINAVPVEINDAIPSDSKLRGVVGELTNGRAAGASSMHAEHVKAWLHDMRREEDPKSQGAVGTGDNWRLFARLVQAAWTHSIIP